MKRNDWAGGFWAKAAAFFLAVVLVPVLLSYGTALAFSYSGELRGDFYESSICSSAVYREMSHVYDSYHYYAENGQTEVLAKYDDWYPADDRYTNVRFSIEDEAGTILFDNHRTGDVPVTGWWGEMAQDGVVFRSYIAVDYPAQDSVYRARDFYHTMTRLAPHAAAVVLACAAAELFFLVFLARAAGRRPGREEAVAGWQEKLPFDLYVLLLLGGGGVLVVAAVESAEQRLDRFDPIALALLLAFAALAYALFLALDDALRPYQTGEMVGEHRLLLAPPALPTGFEVVLARALPRVGSAGRLRAGHSARVAHGGRLLCDRRAALCA